MSSDDLSELSSKLNECLQNLNDLQKSYSSQTQFVAHFKSFLLCLSGCLGGIKSQASLPCSRPSRGKVLLCVSQVCKALTLFPSLLRQPPCRQSVWYLCERLAWCLAELRRVLSASATTEDEDAAGSDSFLSQVDRALTLLVSFPLTPSWKQLIDDLVCQAVTVAKIASDTDYKEITSACHQLLEESSQLEGDVKQLSLLKDSLTVSLHRLEQRTNIAILRLMLQVFSDPNKPVKELVKRCARRERGGARDALDLEPLIAQLDAHVERICLIAQYATTCCQDTLRSRGIQCCLASLESVDNCLVPALTALYLIPGSEEHQQFLHFLCEHWRDQLSCLHTHLDAILDSHAFSQIVSESVSDLCVELRRRGGALDPAQLVVKQGWVLYKHLSRSSDLVLDNQLISRLKQVVSECDTAVYQQASLAVVVKRVESVSAVVDDICTHLAVADTGISLPCSSDQSTEDSPSQTVNSIRDLPLDISLTSSSKSQYNSYRPNWLRNKICEAKDNLKKPYLNLTDIIIKNSSFQKNKNAFGSAEISRSENNSLRDNSTSTNKSAFSSAQTPKPESNHLINNVFETPKNSSRNAIDLLTPYLSQKCERSRTLYVRTPRQLVHCRVLEDSLASETESENRENYGSLALEITDILENLSSLALDSLAWSSLSSTGEANCTQVKPPLAPDSLAGERKHNECCGGGSGAEDGTSTTSLGLSLASVRTEEVSDVNTPQRLQDLRDLDERIFNLKLL